MSQTRRLCNVQCVMCHQLCNVNCVMCNGAALDRFDSDITHYTMNITHSAPGRLHDTSNITQSVGHVVTGPLS